jgi:putative ABC transport system permease protein
MPCAMSSISNHNGAFDRTLVALRKIPGPILAILLALALGIGVNTAIFTVEYVIFLGPLPYPHPDDLVAIRSEVQGHDDGVSAGDFINWKQQTTVFQDLNASTEGAFKITTHDGPQNIAASLVTPGFYRMMGDRFYLGDGFTAEDETAGREQVVILAHAMWKRLGADPVIVGTTIHMDGEPYTVVGVLAPGLRDRGAPVTVPLAFKPEPLNQDYQRVNVIGRLKSGVSIRQAQANIDMVAARPTHSYANGNKGWSHSVDPIKSASFPNERKLMIWLLLGVVVFVLLMECMSVANLLRLRSDAGYQLRS